MHIKSKSAVIGAALEDWRSRGLLDAETTKRLQDDLDRSQRLYSFTGFVIAAGVLCLCFAAMTFVAANWEEMSRLARLVLILAALWAAWGAAVWTGLRRLRWWHEGSMLLASGLFGAGIMLVSQIYHIQGNAADAVWLWAVGTLIAALLARGRMVLILAVGLFALWHAMQIDTFAAASAVNLPYLGWWLAGATLAWWQRNRGAAHVTVIALCFWLLSAVATVAASQLAALVLALVALIAISGLLASLSASRLLRGFERAGLTYAVLLLGFVLFLLTLNGGDAFTEDATETDGSAAGLFLLVALLAIPLGLAVLGRLRRWDLTYDLWIAAGAASLVLVVHGLPPLPLLPEALLLAVFIWITRMGWRLDQRSLHVVGIGGFMLSLLVIYGETVGTLIGTSGFYLGAGLVLLGGAWMAMRLDPNRGADT